MIPKAVASPPAGGPATKARDAVEDASQERQSPLDRPDSEEPLAIRMPVDIRSAALTVLAGLAIVLVLQYAQAMIIPIVLALLISYALEPVVAWLVRRRVPRPLGAAIVLLTLVTSGSGMLYGLRSEASAIVEQLPQAARRLRQSMESDGPQAANAIQQMQKAATELEKVANAATPPAPRGNVQRVQLETPGINISDYVMWGSLGVVAAVGQLVLILFLVFFLLSSGDLYRRKLVKIVGPSLTDKKVTVQILEEIDRQIEMFLVVELFTSLIVGTASWLAFRALGLQQAALWGVLAGLFNTIPYFGPVIVTTATAVVAFLQFGSVWM
ncbi:MAG: AI-2E family transporter, partial [Vicinamibacterales bacterium]